MARGDRSAWGVVGVGVGGSLVATAATACCVPILAPLLVSLLGVSGAVWAARLEPYAAWLLGLSVLSLAAGFRMVYRPRVASPEAACPSRRPVAVRLTLWGATLLWLLAAVLNLLRWLAGMAA